jgi:flagellar biosynthesis component FlhA
LIHFFSSPLGKVRCVKDRLIVFFFSFVKFFRELFGEKFLFDFLQQDKRKERQEKRKTREKKDKRKEKQEKEKKQKRNRTEQTEPMQKVKKGKK